MTAVSSLALKMEKLSDLTGSVALVTGGGTGVGLMIAKGLASKGAKVYITGRRLEVLQKAVAENEVEEPGCIAPIQMDVTDKESIISALEQVERNDGKLNILVNNAGIQGPGRITAWTGAPESVAGSDTISAYGQDLFQQSYEEWDKIGRTNVAAAFFVTTAFLGLLAKSAEAYGRISSVINISSVAAHNKLHLGFYAYDCSKAALSHFTRLLATDLSLKRAPIRVNCISPGPFPSQFLPSEKELDAMLQTSFLGSLVPHPMRRAGREEEMAALAVYLASPLSDYVQGQDIIIDGGLHSINP